MHRKYLMLDQFVSGFSNLTMVGLSRKAKIDNNKSPNFPFHTEGFKTFFICDLHLIDINVTLIDICWWIKDLWACVTWFEQSGMLKYTLKVVDENFQKWCAILLKIHLVNWHQPVHQIQQSTKLNHNFWQHRMILTNRWIHWYFATMLFKSILRLK